MDDLRRDRSEDQSFEAVQSARTHDDFSAMLLPRHLDNRLRRITHSDECPCVYMIFRQDGGSTFQVLFVFRVMMLLDHGTNYEQTRRERQLHVQYADMQAFPSL